MARREGKTNERFVSKRRDAEFRCRRACVNQAACCQNSVDHGCVLAGDVAAPRQRTFGQRLSGNSVFFLGSYRNSLERPRIGSVAEISALSFPSAGQCLVEHLFGEGIDVRFELLGSVDDCL